MRITLEVHETVVRRYARAARATRMALHGNVPTTEQMMALVLADRPPSPVVLDRQRQRRERKRGRPPQREADE